jgi:TPR repeat protein
MELAAQTGTADALFELGMLYATGLDLPVDLVVAHNWFNLAAMRGNRAALSYRKDLANEMTAGQIAEAQRLAREWLATEKLATQSSTTELAAGLRGADRLAAERRAIEAFAAERFGATRLDDDHDAGEEQVALEIEVDDAGRLAA